MVEVAWFLARFGEPQEGRPSSPPRELGTDVWKLAYAAFYGDLSEGRSLSSFSNSLKNARDAFDSWLGSGNRTGWRSEDSDRGPLPLTRTNAAAHKELSPLSRDEVWRRVQRFADLRVVNAKEEVFAAIETLESSDSEGAVRTEGGVRVYVSSRVERNPRLRDDGIRAHGMKCQVCGFDFATAYGDWGKGYIEVHHLSMVAENPNPRQVDPAKELAVVCANCHRMLHRKRGKVLSLEALRAMVQQAR